jgi:phosphonate transport system permease protein
MLVWKEPSNHSAGMKFVPFLEIVQASAAFFRKLGPQDGKPWPVEYLADIRKAMLETIKIAFAASLIGSALALPYALIGARNLVGARWVYNLGRGLLNLIRTVPDLVLAALLAATFGIGPFPGLLALIIFSFGVVAKLLCDTLETVDPGPLEAVRATGGTRFQQAVFAAFPQVAPDFAAYTLYAFEINVRAAAVLGLVGAGGIGLLLQTNIAFLNYPRVGLIILVTFGVVLAIDTFSTWLRSRLV